VRVILNWERLVFDTSTKPVPSITDESFVVLVFVWPNQEFIGSKFVPTTVNNIYMMIQHGVKQNLFQLYYIKSGIGNN
jgi:hypothetical protein